MKVLVAIPTPGSINVELVLFLLNEFALASRGQHKFSICFDKGIDICRARNKIVKVFLESDNEALMMLDSDVIPPIGAIGSLIEANKPIVAGVYFGFDEIRNSPIHPIMNGVTKIDERYATATRAGAGCMLVKREVFEKMRDHLLADRYWPPFMFNYSQDGDVHTLAEDWRFCDNARACEYTIWVDHTLICRHMKSLSPETLMRFLPPPDQMFEEEATNEARNGKDYWDGIWRNEGINTWRQYPQTFGRICEIIGSGKNVLDVGCGVGILAKKIKDAGNDAFGFDISEAAISEMDAKFGICGVAGKAPPIPWQDKAFDWTVATEFLEHFSPEEGEEVVAEMARVGKNSIFTTPNNILTPNECREHCNTFTPDTLRTLLEKYYNEVTLEEFTDEFSASGQSIALPTILAICKEPKTKP